MHRPAIPALLGTATLLLTFASCQDASQESREAGGTPAVTVATDTSTNVQPTVDAQVDGLLLDPNQATREELLAVPNVDEPLADAIVAGRPYNDMLAVDRVLAGRLSKEQREAVYARLWKPLHLNRASGEEILLIPGVGPKMRHEFEEYRPYRSMEQFRREIGKYVDDAELARLERYVMVR